MGIFGTVIAIFSTPNKLIHANAYSNFLKKFGNLETNPIQIRIRILPPPMQEGLAQDLLLQGIKFKSDIRMIHKTTNITMTSGIPTFRDRISSDYISEISRTSVMSPEEEQDIFREYIDSRKRVEDAKSNPSLSMSEVKDIADREAKVQDRISNKVITSNQRFVFAMAKRYCNNEILMDLVSVGTIGMIRAMETFDPAKNVRFCTYAGWYIKREINNYLFKEHLPVKSYNCTKVLPKAKKEINDFFLKNGRKPSYDELSAILFDKYGLTIETESDASEAKLESLNAHIGGDEDFAFEDSDIFISATSSHNDYEDAIKDESMAYTAKQALSCLTERERNIVCLSTGYGVDKEYRDDEIGEMLGITAERVRQIRLGIQKKMAKYANRFAYTEARN